jgi:hypothetical protein
MLKKKKTVDKVYELVVFNAEVKAVMKIYDLKILLHALKHSVNNIGLHPLGLYAVPIAVVASKHVVYVVYRLKTMKLSPILLVKDLVQLLKLYVTILLVLVGKPVNGRIVVHSVVMVFVCDQFNVKLMMEQYLMIPHVLIKFLLAQ